MPMMDRGGSAICSRQGCRRRCSFRRPGPRWISWIAAFPGGGKDGRRGALGV